MLTIDQFQRLYASGVAYLMWRGFSIEQAQRLAALRLAYLQFPQAFHGRSD